MVLIQPVCLAVSVQYYVMHQYFEGKKVSLNKSIFALKETRYQKNSTVFRQKKVGAEV
jgi:hypothetical protein